MGKKKSKAKSAKSGKLHEELVLSKKDMLDLINGDVIEFDIEGGSCAVEFEDSDEVSALEDLRDECEGRIEDAEIDEDQEEAEEELDEDELDEELDDEEEEEGDAEEKE